MERPITWLKQMKQMCSCEHGKLCEFTCQDSTCKLFKQSYCKTCMLEFTLHPHKPVEITEESTWQADIDKLNDVCRDFKEIIARCETYLPIMFYLSNSLKPDFKSEYLSDYKKLVAAASGVNSIRNEF